MSNIQDMTPDEQWVELLWETFKWSVDQQDKDIQRLKSLQATYDNSINEDRWPTQSKIPLPVSWSSVESALGPAMEYLFPAQPFSRLISTDDMDQNTLDQLQWALHLMLVHRMDVKDSLIRSIKDCFKVGVGYAIVEPVIVTPPSVAEVRMGGNRARVMRRGAPVTSLRCRYLSSGKVIPYPAGVDFNGSDATPFAYLLDLYPEHQFRAMCSDGREDGEATVFACNADGVVEDARSHGFTSQTSYIDLLDKMSGRTMHANGMQSAGENVPVMIPVLKCYADTAKGGRHTFLYCGSERQIIFDKENTFDTMRKPLIKFDAWRDADRWFPMSQPEAEERVAWGKNVLFNAVLDLVSMSLKRPLIYDSERQDQAPQFGPTGVVGLPGDVRQTARFLDPPGLDAGTLNFLDRVDALHDEITGERDLSQRNYNRGGADAFQRLARSLTGRQRLRHALLETGGVKSVVVQTLTFLQSMGGMMDLRFQRPAFSRELGDYVERFAVTEDDFKHQFMVLLDLAEKNRTNDMDDALRLQLHNIKAQSPYLDQYAVWEDLYTDEYQRQREMLSRAEVERKQAELEQAQLEGMRRRGGEGPAQGAAEAATAGRLEGGAAQVG